LASIPSSEILQDLLVVEEEVALTVQNLLDGGRQDLVVIAMEP
jgi:hypothetical protein